VTQRMATTRPLWTCPCCKHQFVSANLWHSCTLVGEGYRDLGMQGALARARQP